MPRPSKTVDNIARHATKSELETRKSAENAMITGKKLKERAEVKSNEIAHREFLRVSALLNGIGKNDAMYEVIINRYCVLQAECSDFERKRALFSENLENLIDDEEIKSDTKYRLEAQMQKSIIDVDKQIQAKRRMLFDIEKECAMTISAALRSIPKTPDKQVNPLLEVLKGGTG